MSTPKAGWIARDGDGLLYWFEMKPEWDEYNKRYHAGDIERLESSDYPDLKPGECMQIIDAQQMGRAGAAFEAEAHRKTLAELAALRARLEEAERENAYLQSELAEAYDIINGLAGWIEQQYVEQGRSQSEIDDLMDREWNFLDKHEDEIERWLEDK